MLRKLIPSLLALGLGLAGVHAQAAPKYDIFRGTYGEHTRHAADLYVPSSGTSSGLMVWIHGGSWSSGDKSDGIQKIVNRVSPYGIAVLAMNYRLGSDGAFPKSIQDVQTVLSAVEQGGCHDCTGDTWRVAQQYASKGIILTGFSAGGYLSVMGGMNYLRYKPNSSLTCINNVVGPVDLRDSQTVTEAQRYAVTVLSDGKLDPRMLSQMSPVTYLKSGIWAEVVPKVRWYLGFNKADTLVNFDRTADFSAALKKAGVRGSMEVVDESKGGGHGLAEATALRLVTYPAIDCLVQNSVAP